MGKRCRSLDRVMTLGIFTPFRLSIRGRLSAKLRQRRLIERSGSLCVSRPA